MAEISTIKWRKIPHHPKWIGRMDGKHVASILVGEQVRVWLDLGDGWREALAGDIPADAKALKRAVERMVGKEKENWLEAIR